MKRSIMFRTIASVFLVAATILSSTSCSYNNVQESKKAGSEQETQAVKSPRPTAAKSQETIIEKPAEPLPSYQFMLDNIDSLVGTEYAISGRVTGVSGWLRSENYFVRLYWDESETRGEIASVRIPNENYNESVCRYFKGNCTLEGLDDNGWPQFVCYSYTTECP